MKTQSQPSSVWSFDIGTGSFGYAIRRSDGGRHEFLEVKSLLIPPDHASVKTARLRRRMLRTREAHKAREAWLRDCFHAAGLSDAVLEGRRTEKLQEPGEGKRRWVTIAGDWRLEREFPPKLGSRTRDGAPTDEIGSSTCYCGALLRIKLLHDEALEPWQIFKALHNVIQKRGYDPDLPWKNRGRERKDDDDAGETLERANAAEQEMRALSPDNPRHWLPSYLEAHEMGLWSPHDPRNTSNLRQNHEAKPAKGRVFLRSTVEKELRALLAAAERQLPMLAGRTDSILYGPTGKPYASFNPQVRSEYRAATGKDLVEGKATDWQGVLAQKIPTFDNRAVSACALIPRFHAAKAAPRVRKKEDGARYFDEDSLLPAEVTFLMKLKNLRFATTDGQQGRFSVELIREVFEQQRKAVLKKVSVGEFKLTKTALAKWIERAGGVAALVNQEKIDPPRESGRSRFSKPALRIVRDLILSGRSPAEFHARVLGGLNGNTDPRSGLVADDLGFLLRIKSSGAESASWENFYLPDQSLSFLESDDGTRTDKIQTLIGKQINPIVRHRLETFWRLLQTLEERHGRPDYLALEFVREDFMGEKAKLELAKFQKLRREARAEARKEVGGGKDMLRYQLMKDQGGVCIYCGSGLGLSDLPSSHLDHIVPDKMGGPGSYWNFVVCCGGCNDAKGKRTPFQWFHEDHREGWDAYTSRVRARTFQLKPKKVRLLTLPEAPDLVQRYQSLAETTWIARLAQTLACLHFGWPRNFADGPRRVVVLPGGLTARVRRKYRLDSLLGGEIAELAERLDQDGDAKAEFEIEKKCRADKRHHALDAMVLSFLPQWTSDPTKLVQVRLPESEGIHRDFFARYIEDVEPLHVAFPPAVLRDTTYGLRTKGNETVAVSRFELKKLGFASEDMNGKLLGFSADKLKRQANEILDPQISRAIRDFAETGPTEEEWLAFAEAFRLHDGGPRVVKVARLSNKPKPANYKDFSKDGTGAWKTSKEGHKGQFIYIDSAGVPRVKAVMVFESPREVRSELAASPDFVEWVGFFQSLCGIEIDSTVEHTRKTIPPGRYTLRTLKSDGRASFTSAKGRKYDDVPISKLIPAGFRRCSE